MPITIYDTWYDWKTKINEIYDGNTRIKKVMDGSEVLFEAETIEKIYDYRAGTVPVRPNGVITDLVFRNRDTYIIGRSSAHSLGTFDGMYRLNKNARNVYLLASLSSDIYNKIGSNGMTNVCTNGKYILFMDYYSKYMLYDISNQTFSEIVDITEAGNCAASCIDDTYSYFAYTNTLIRLNNSTKESTTFTNSINPYRMISDDNYVYMFDSSGNCYIFDKNNSTFSLFASAPSGISNLGSVNYLISSSICQNDKYIFQICQTSDYKYNQLLITDKTNGTSSFVPGISDTEMLGTWGDAPDVSITCSNEYLFVAGETKIYIFDLSNVILTYKTVDISEYKASDSISRIIIGLNPYNNVLHITVDGVLYKKHQYLLYKLAK